MIFYIHHLEVFYEYPCRFREHRKYRIYVDLRQLGHANDSRAGFLLWRTCRTEKCAGDHDAELPVARVDHGNLVCFRLFAMLRSKLAWNYRRSHLLRVSSWGDAEKHVFGKRFRYSIDRTRCLSDDVRDHYASFDHRGV